VRCALIHGFTGDPANWDEVIDNWQLPQEPQPIALPGHCVGGPVLEGWDANLDAVGAAIDGCECVVGYSLGARVALGLVATGRAAFGVLIGVNPGINELERRDRRITGLLRRLKLSCGGLQVPLHRPRKRSTRGP